MLRRGGTGALLAVAAALSLLPCGAAGQAPGSLVVQVRSGAGGALAAVLVSVRPAQDSAVVQAAASDAAGRVIFPVLRPGQYLVRAERIGYAPAEQAVAVASGVLSRSELVLAESAVALPGLMVEAERRRARFEETAGSTVGELTQLELKLVPTIGEADVLRAIEVLPGVVSTSDFSSAFNVRGGSADQNLILLDGLPVYNPFHLGGVFSVFNADMVARAQLLSGGFPPRYGGRVSSVLGIESEAGGPGTEVQAGLSLLATRVAVGTDLPQGLLDAAGLRSGRARLSARRSYFDQLLRPFFDFPYHLTDVQLFAEAWTPGGGRLSVSGYAGEDVLDLAGTDSFPLQVRWDWGNQVAGAAWIEPLDGGGTLEVRAGYSRFATGIRFPEFGDTDFRGRVDQWLGRADLTVPAGPLRLGAGLALDRLRYANRAETGGAAFRRTGEGGWLTGAYAQAGWSPGAWLLEAGLRADAWRAAAAPADGPRGGGSATVLQPRLAVKRFIGSGDQALRFAIGRYAQFAHSVRDEELPLGIDIWVLTGARAPHVVSDQVQGGVEGYLGPAWFGALEVYYRSFDGVTATNSADDPDDPFDDLLEGRGVSWGADFLMRRERGRVRPMLAVSWLRAWREFPDALAGMDPPPTLRYAPVFDRRLDADLVVQAMLGRDIELGLRWNLGTGLPYTRPLGAYVYHEYSLIEGRWRFEGGQSDTARSAIVLGPRNAERYPAYHRLDVSVRRTYRKAWGTLTPHLDLLNVYNRRNVLFYFYDYDETPATRSGISMFPFLPTAGVEVRF
jgi:hypothetical protein